MTTILSTMKTTSFSRIAQLVCGSQILIWGAQSAQEAEPTEFYSEYYCAQGADHKIDVVKDSDNDIVIKDGGTTAKTDLDFAKYFIERAQVRGFPEDLVAQECTKIKDEKHGSTCWCDKNYVCNFKLPHFRFQIQLKSESRSDTSYILTLDIRTNEYRVCGTDQCYIHIKFEKMPKSDDDIDRKWRRCPELSVPQILHRLFKAKPRYAQYQKIWCCLSRFFCCKSKCNTGKANCISFVKIMHQAIEKEGPGEGQFSKAVETYSWRNRRNIRAQAVIHSKQTAKRLEDERLRAMEEGQQLSTDSKSDGNLGELSDATSESGKAVNEEDSIHVSDEDLERVIQAANSASLDDEEIKDDQVGDDNV